MNEQFSEDFLDGYHDGFWDGADVAVQELIDTEEINSAADLLRGYGAELSEDLVEKNVEEIITTCESLELRNDERFSRVMDEYRQIFPCEERADDIDDFTYGTVVGSAHGLLEVVLWNLEKSCKEVGAPLDEDFVIRLFIDSIHFVTKAFASMSRDRVAMIRSAKRELVSTDNPKILKFPSVQNHTGKETLS
jgi:hypothetical protein